MSFLKRLTDSFRKKDEVEIPKVEEKTVIESVAPTKEEPIREPAPKEEVSEPETPEISLVKTDGPRKPAHIKLRDEKSQMRLIHLIAQGLSLHQIVDKLNDEIGIKIHYTTVNQYRNSKKWAPKIQELAQMYRDRLDLIDSSHKSVRVRRMEEVFDKSIQKGNIRNALSANEQIRKEFQSDSTGDVTINMWNNPVYQQLNTLSNEELIRRHKEATARLKKGN